jgi:hypothetical protein
MKYGRFVKKWIEIRQGIINRKYVFKDEYVCVDCGYTESYIQDKDIVTIREHSVSESQY